MASSGEFAEGDRNIDEVDEVLLDAEYSLYCMEHWREMTGTVDSVDLEAEYIKQEILKMPYINQDDRIQMHKGRLPLNAGELNYAFTVLIIDYWKRAPRYQTANDIVGALEGAKAEFQRRILAKYEDSKIVENGDVY